MNLRERITIFKYNLTQGDAGFQDQEREDVKETWADVDPMTEKRALEFGQIVGNRNYFIYMRVESLPSLNNDMLIEWTDKGVSRILVIHSVLDFDARGVYFQIIASDND